MSDLAAGLLVSAVVIVAIYITTGSLAGWSKKLIAVMVLAFAAAAIPWFISSYLLIAIAGISWFVIAVLYYRSVRTKSALLIFALLPMILWPFVLFLLLGAAVFLGHGNF